MAKIRRYDIVAAGDINQSETTTVVHGNHYTSGGKTSRKSAPSTTTTTSGTGARTCTACGGTRGWSMSTRNGKTTTTHSCGAVQ